MERVLIFSVAEDTSEIKSLLDTLSISVADEFLQRRPHPHNVGFLGPGKLDKVEEAIKDCNFDAIAVNGSLKPSQHHYLEMRFQKECVDRTGIILRIFAEHAHTPEAIAQVTLARLRYELPFLREWIHKAKHGDRPGFLAGGAYATDVYYEHAKAQARRIEANLKELSKQRVITRAKRHARGYSLVSLAGYTNAGKSALFNKLCGSNVEVDDRLFSTLSTTTRKVLKVPGNVLMVDTVGFIKDLPPDLVNAFNSTLEEIFFADLILLVFDASEPLDVVKSKLRTSVEILLPKIEDQTLVVLGNKSDSLSRGRARQVLTEISPLVGKYPFLMVSAKTEEGLEQVRILIGRLQRQSLSIHAELPLADSVLSLLSRIRSTSQVTETFDGRKIKVLIKCKQEDGQKIIGWLEKAGATKVEKSNESPSIDDLFLKEGPKEAEGPPSHEAPVKS